MNWLPGLGWVNWSPASFFTETSVVATSFSVIVPPTLETLFALVTGVLPDAGVNVATEVATLLTAEDAPRSAIALTPIQAKTSTAMMPSAIQRPVRRFFGGGCGG